MTADEFVAKWAKTALPERSASQEHFLDLCRLLGQPTPAEADPTGERYCFEKAVKVVAAASKGSKGEGGFVDVWRRDCFGWEYKRKDKYKSLDEAYRQLYQYRDALDNPPLSIVCDIRTTEIRTHFTGYPTDKIVIRLEELPARLEVLRRAFTNPESFRPFKKSVEVTADLAKEFGELADKLIARYPPNDLNLFERAGDPVAHFLMKVMFCLFAEDIDLLPDKLFTRLINRCLFDPDAFVPACGELFEKMKRGGWYGNDRVEHFNGGLFDDAPPLPLNHGELNDLARAAGRDWSAVEPSIFGTLFERILDPRKRAQIGAHYTSKEDILLVVDPVVMAPLRRRWQAVQAEIKPALDLHDAEPDRKARDGLAAPVRAAIDGFRDHLHAQRVLDPACGSGNFLYVALQRLLDLEDEAVRFAAKHDVTLDPTPRVRPTQMHGIEINRYAAELAQVVVWIGFLQWTHVHGISDERRPILDKLEMIENRDAILDLTDKAHPKRAEWPASDVIIGNPPFLGVRNFRDSGMTNEYLAALGTVYDLPRTSDLCCYWFQLALLRANLSSVRSGLLATQAIRSTDNREVLRRITADATIFWAWANRAWTVNGADVRVAMIGFAKSADDNRLLDNQIVDAINSDLSSGSDATSAQPLAEMRLLSFQGPVKVGPFEIDSHTAHRILATPTVLTANISLGVVRPWYNGIAISRRWGGEWIIDFGLLSQAEASLYEAAFQYVEEHVRPVRKVNRRASRADKWWLFGEPNPKMRAKLKGLNRFIATPRVSKHRVFVWLDAATVPDARVVGIASETDYMFGVLQSSLHELWSYKTGAWHGVGNDLTYNNSVTFDTFPLPWPPGQEDTSHPAYQRVAAAAKALDEKRERWLNPPEWVDPIAAKVDAADDFADVPAEARPLIRRSAIMAAAAKDARLKNRTLTKLYNERPTWLRLAHEQLDRAVLAAYAATDPAGGWDEDWAAVWVETGAGQPLPADHPLSAVRRASDAAVLKSLLRLNAERATNPS